MGRRPRHCPRHRDLIYGDEVLNLVPRVIFRETRSLSALAGGGQCGRRDGPKYFFVGHLANQRSRNKEHLFC